MMRWVGRPHVRPTGCGGLPGVAPVRGGVKIAVVLLLVLPVVGLLVIAVSRARHTADRTHCRTNLLAIGLALQSYHDVYGHFPTGTLPNADLPPDKRLSWATEVWPLFM